MKLPLDLIDIDDDRYIGSALGGEGSLLRYYVVLYHISKKSVDVSFLQYVEACLGKANWKLEFCYLKEDAIIFCVLVSMNIALDEVVMKCIDAINQHGDCVLRGYGALNTSELTDEFISHTREYLRDQYYMGKL